MHPEVELIGADENGEPVDGAYFQGVEAGRKYLADLREVLASPVVHFEELKAAGNQVIATLEITGALEGQKDGMAISAVQSIEFEGGLVRRVTSHRKPMDGLRREDWRPD